MNNYNPNTGAFMASNDNPYKTEKSEKIKQTKLDEILGNVLNEYIDITGESEDDFGEGITTLTDALSKAKQQISELIDDVIEKEISGLMFMFEHQWGGEDKERVCEICHEVVTKGSPCKASKYYNEWLNLNTLKERIEQRKKELV